MTTLVPIVGHIAMRNAQHVEIASRKSSESCENIPFNVLDDCRDEGVRCQVLCVTQNEQIEHVRDHPSVGHCKLMLRSSVQCDERLNCVDEIQRRLDRLCLLSFVFRDRGKLELKSFAERNEFILHRSHGLPSTHHFLGDSVDQTSTRG